MKPFPIPPPGLWIALALLSGAASFVNSADDTHDWPMWGYDAARSWTSPMEIPAKLHLEWTLRLPAPQQLAHILWGKDADFSGILPGLAETLGGCRQPGRQVAVRAGEFEEADK